VSGGAAARGAAAAADVVVIGGGVIGAAVACWLKAFEGFAGRVLVLERDPTHARASTALSASGIRLQFTTPVNIALSRFGLEVIRDFPELMATSCGPAPDLALKENGYLFLAGSETAAAGLRAAAEVQRAEGVPTELLAPDEIAARFPWLRTADLTLGSFLREGQGWFDNMGLLRGLREKAREAGAEFRHAEAAALRIKSGRVTAVTLAGGEAIPCGLVVDAAGPRAAEVCGWAGLPLPVRPRKRTVFAFDAADPPPPDAPLTIDPTGCWCRPEGAGFIGAAPPDPDPDVAPDDFEPRHEEWEGALWPALAARSPGFEALKLRGFWAGHYEWNTDDQNGLVGPHPGCEGLLIAAGFSGHGLQHAVGVGRGIAEWIMHGGWRSLDLSPLAASRIERGAAAPEAAVI